MVRIIIALLAIAMSNSAYAISQVTATVDKNPVTIKESIILTVIADDDVNTSALDTSPLIRDFIVGRTSVSTQTSMINFKTSRTTKWQTVLIPRKVGVTVVPSLSIEGHKTAPITLTVLDANDPNATAQQDVFITAEISSKDVFVQQMLTLKVKLHFAAELKRGSLTEPVLEGATITQIGKDGEAETIVNGRRYRVIERNYAVTPQQSGDFTLRSPMFSGEIMVQSARRSNFLSFGETKAISVLGEEIKLSVKPIPESFQGHWLPSELITLHQEWQSKNDEFVVGEPITRTITLTAVGLTEEQLPALNIALPKGLKVYPDQATKHANLNNGRFVSQSVQNFAIVASKAGEYQLPAIEVPWWNTVTNRLESATLPAQVVTIKVNSEEVEAADFILENNQAQTRDIEQIPTKIVEQSPFLQWLFLALWILTLLAWLTVEILRKQKQSKISLSHHPKINDAQLAIMAACKKRHGHDVLKLLVPWFNGLPSSKHKVTTIDQIRRIIGDCDLTRQIDKLQQHYYGNSSESQWQGSELLNAILEINKAGIVDVSQPKFSLNP